MNILTQNASTVGAIDLGFYNINKNNNFTFFDKLKNKEFKLLYLVGSDNLEIKKNDEFIIYQGSHGDKNASIADVILPCAAYTEQNGLFENLEGRIQECKKASYPTNESLEDWKIFNLINIVKENEFSDFVSIRKLALQEIPNFSEIDLLPKTIKSTKTNTLLDSSSEKIKIKAIDYYFSNSIARASKTMSDCRNISIDNKKNGTNKRFANILLDELFKIAFIVLMLCNRSAITFGVEVCSSKKKRTKCSRSFWITSNHCRCAKIYIKRNYYTGQL